MSDMLYVHLDGAIVLQLNSSSYSLYSLQSISFSAERCYILHSLENQTLNAQREPKFPTTRLINTHAHIINVVSSTVSQKPPIKCFFFVFLVFCLCLHGISSIKDPSDTFFRPASIVFALLNIVKICNFQCCSQAANHFFRYFSKTYAFKRHSTPLQYLCIPAPKTILFSFSPSLVRIHHNICDSVFVNVCECIHVRVCERASVNGNM